MTASDERHRQYLDSVNVPPPTPFQPCGRRWAFVTTRSTIASGALSRTGEAHRRLCAQLDTESVYHQSSHPGLSTLVGRLARSSWDDERRSRALFLRTDEDSLSD